MLSPLRMNICMAVRNSVCDYSLVLLGVVTPLMSPRHWLPRRKDRVCAFLPFDLTAICHYCTTFSSSCTSAVGRLLAATDLQVNPDPQTSPELH